jgi:hypothetical protein
LRVHRESGRVVVIPAHGDSRLVLHPLDNFVRIRTVINQIANAPKFIEIALWQCIKGRKVAVDIRDDDDLQRPSFPCPEDNCAPAISDSELSGCFWEQVNPDELSPGVIICPSTLTRKGRDSGWGEPLRPALPISGSTP